MLFDHHPGFFPFRLRFWGFDVAIAIIDAHANPNRSEHIVLRMAAAPGKLPRTSILRIASCVEALDVVVGSVSQSLCMTTFQRRLGCGMERIKVTFAGVTEGRTTLYMTKEQSTPTRTRRLL